MCSGACQEVRRRGGDAGAPVLREELSLQAADHREPEVPVVEAGPVRLGRLPAVLSGCIDILLLDSASSASSTVIIVSLFLFPPFFSLFIGIFECPVQPIRC